MASHYDWLALKQQYLTSIDISIRAFLRSNSIPLNRNAFQHTKGWKAEKQALSKQAEGIAHEKLQEELTNAHYHLTELAIMLAPKLKGMLEAHIQWRAMTSFQRKQAIEEANRSGKPLPERLSVFEYCTLTKLVTEQLGMNASPGHSSRSEGTLAAIMAELEAEEQ